MNITRKLGAFTGVTVLGVLFSAVAAFATGPLDGVTTQANAAVTELTTFVTTTGVPIIFGLLILGVGISLAVKYVRRGARAA